MPVNLTSQQKIKIFHFGDYENMVNKTEIIMETHRRVCVLLRGLWCWHVPDKLFVS